MHKSILAVAFATVLVAPASAQSFDPSVGSGNIARQVTGDNPLAAHAEHAPKGRRAATHGVQPFSAGEKALFGRIPSE